MSPASWGAQTRRRLLSARHLRHAKVRVNLGEAWMIKGRPDLACEQLKNIFGICNTDCEEYRDLQVEINSHPEV